MLKPVVVRYRGKVSRIYFRADAGFANPDVYEYLEAEGIKYAIRLPKTSWVSVRSPLMAASATLALKPGVWFRRGRLLMVSPDSQATACPPSGRNST